MSTHTQRYAAEMGLDDYIVDLQNNRRVVAFRVARTFEDRARWRRTADAPYVVQEAIETLPDGSKYELAAEITRRLTSKE